MKYKSSTEVPSFDFFSLGVSYFKQPCFRMLVEADEVLSEEGDGSQAGQARADDDRQQQVGGKL